MAAGHTERGALILALVMVVGNLNTIFLSAYAFTIGLPLPFFAQGLPRLLHDLFAIYGILFWLWQALDAYRSTPVTKVA